MRERRRLLIATILASALVLPFLGKPVHVDDANFLHLAEGAARDPWRPHAIDINWLGRTRPAFAVLSNPPGVAWWLMPVRDAPIWVLHLWMTPWLALALWGFHRLGKTLADDASAAVLVLGTSPVVVLAAQSLTPDLPLLACTVAGMGGFLAGGRHAWLWALVLGCAGLFRYSGFLLVPLVALVGMRTGRTASALPALIPGIGLAVHDLLAYGQIHALAMAGFQGVSNTPRLVFRKGVAEIAMLGGAGVLPVVAWHRASWAWALAGGALGACAAWWSQLGWAQAAVTVAFAAAGGVSLGALRLRDPTDRLLCLWAAVGAVFLLTLRLAATRYWLPFLPAVALAALRRSPSSRRVAVAASIAAMISLGMSVDDHAMARAYRDAARRVSAIGPGTFSGHWGWQYYMERAGWTPLESGGEPGRFHAKAVAPWPVEPAHDVCLEAVETLELPDRWPGPRVHTAAGAANVHHFLVSAYPIQESYAPWTFADEPYDTITVYRRCDTSLDPQEAPEP